ncbi:MAG TPA: oxidoreductase [Porticoccaceae bacterium]|nr:oxidoreductase [Porticoccaceae bacterium]
MIGRLETALRRFRRRFSRSEWVTKLLDLPVNETAETDAGLILIQIDGLSCRELQRALEKKEMPFLNRLLQKEHYRLDDLYSGLPSTTAAVQAELYYGVKTAVPAFCFMDRETQQLVRMYEPRIVSCVEAKLRAQGHTALLANGSCYVSNYRGGATEAHYSPAALGWGAALRDARPPTLIFLLATHFWSFIRTGTLLFIELILACIDCIRGLIQGQHLLKELLFVPTRIVITILMREMATVGTKIDIARGLPIIQLNFLGYDEQAHRRGPSSAFAHWTLKGIDKSIARIWRATHRATRRHYDIWIYSDHGQEQTVAYRDRHGQSLAEALAVAIADGRDKEEITIRATGQSGVELSRARLFGGRRIQRLFPANNTRTHGPANAPLTLASLGPLAMLYYPDLPGQDKSTIARRIVEKTGAPLVLFKSEDSNLAQQAWGWGIDGPVSLPRDSARILGSDHPFLDEAGSDLAAVCHHPDAGDFVICGWQAGSKPVSFAIENGAHGGAGAIETHAFVVLPDDIPMPDSKKGYWRARDLRTAALAHLQPSTHVRPSQKPVRSRLKTLRVMTYNVHRCVGMDGKLSPDRVARVIARHAPDLVALQELDVERARTGWIDQAQHIAQLLEMDYHFHPVIHVAGERYGNAILSHLPMRLIRADNLPSLTSGRSLEPRGVLWVTVDIGETSLQVLNTHLGLLSSERRLQVDALLGEHWLGHPDCEGPVLLCGDFNAGPASAEHRKLRTRLRDTQIVYRHHKPLATFFGRMPQARIDHIFIDSALQVGHIEVPRSELVKLTSDHLPLIVDLKLPFDRNLFETHRKDH